MTFEVWTKDFYQREGTCTTFYDEKELEQFVNENKDTVVSVLQVHYTNLMGKYVPESQTKKRYLVSVNEYGEDAYYCSFVNKQYNVYVYADSEKEAMKLGLDQVEQRYKDSGYTYEAVNCSLRPLDQEEF